MGIADKLIKDQSRIRSYFPGNADAWLKTYQDSLGRIEHDEPWVTLVSMYALFGEKKDWKDRNRLDAFNEILKHCGLQIPPSVTEILEIKVEKQFKEVLPYRQYLHEIAENNIFHHYPDRIDKITLKSARTKASFEGNTNVDLYIEARKSDLPLYFFIEAKFLSDISYQVLYSPARDQISRNIDTGIEFVKEEKKSESIDSLYFLMLTPRQFRTEPYGGNGNPPLHEFHPERSRLYCYKMNEFKDYRMIKAALPHRNELKDEEWKHIAENLGWITFEDIYHQADFHSTMEPFERSDIETFFKDRNLI